MPPPAAAHWSKNFFKLEHEDLDANFEKTWTNTLALRRDAGWHDYHRAAEAGLKINIDLERAGGRERRAEPRDTIRGSPAKIAAAADVLGVKIKMLPF